MKFFLDTANLSDIREGAALGLVDGVTPIHVSEAARIGADVATMPFKVMQQLVKHPLTDKGLDQFLADWRKAA